MTKILFLIPPSEGKNNDGKKKTEILSFSFKKPKKIAIHATEKDLKSKAARFEEWMKFNKLCVNGKSENYERAIERYSWVMYNAIWYNNMNAVGKNFFEENFLILSGMYWILKPTDIIWNYKLPIETKWLLWFWADQITAKIQEINPDYIINLLPLSYQKMLDFKLFWGKIIDVNFYTEKERVLKKMTHWVKKIKWEWIKEICESEKTDYKNFWWEVIKDNQVIEIQIKK